MIFTVVKMEDLIKALKARQEQEGLNDGELAVALGVAPSTISMIFAGKRRPGPYLLHRIVTEFPDLIPDAVKYLQRQPERP